MSNKYITESILAQQAGDSVRLNEADRKELNDREHQVSVTIADRQRQLENIIAMQEWYRKNERATAVLEDTTTHHNHVNKQYLALRGEEMRLNLFDDLQEFHVYYEQIAERRRVIDGIKQQESEVQQRIETTRERLKEAQRDYDVATERLEDAKSHLQQNQEVIDHGYVLDGEIKTLIANLIAAEDALADAQRQLGENEADYRSRQNEIDHVKEQVEMLNLHHQALAVHQQLFEQYQAVNDKIKLYNTETRVNEHAHQQFGVNSQRHRELVILHERLKKDLQGGLDRLDALRADCKVHESAIDEMDSATLYRRYVQSQQRLVGLQSARQAWQIISAGYDAIESQRSSLERLSRQLEQKRQEQAVAERDVKRLFERYNRLNKAFILLQIENTRKLREGLKEGTPCPVCGSAHHPYHTEVEQELGETQTQLEKDYLAAKKGYEEQQVKAAEVVAETQQRAGHLEAERNVLERMMEQQHILESDWERFKRLDTSFTICSSSVNREARRTTIEMLIDSTNRHIKEYEQQISRFDFHTAQLHDVVQKRRAEERAVEELQQQFWQLDKELLLVHERMEMFRTLMAESDSRIEHLYKDLDDVVTVSGWRDDNLEEFSKNLSELYNDWTQTTKNLDKSEHEFEMLRYKAKTAEVACQQQQQVVGNCREERDRLRELLGSKREQLRKDFGNATPAELAASLMQSVNDAYANCKNSEKEYDGLLKELATLGGQRDILSETRRLQEEHLREVSTTLDHAIARYNLTHSAVQASELDAIFTDDRDWVLLRQTVMECRDALLIAKEQMQSAEKRFMALQGASERPSKENEADKPEMLAQRRTELVLELEALRGEQADIRRILERHERSL